MNGHLEVQPLERVAIFDGPCTAGQPREVNTLRNHQNNHIVDVNNT
jgi:hypothetical protein